MEKMSKLWFMLAIAGITMMSSCKKDEEPEPEPEPDACAEATYPTATGDATINLLNFSSSTIEVEAGNVLALAVEVTKGSSRPKKLRLFASDCVNMVGDEYDLSDQPKGGSNGIDLRNTDKPQVRNVNYTVPTGMNPIYLTIQIDEGGGNTNYKQLTLNVSGSGVIDTWSSIELGGNSNALPSRMASGTGQSYAACDAGENIDYIDITYAVSLEAPDYFSYICSNPARFLAPLSLSSSTATDCGDDGDISTSGGNASYFKLGSADFDAATDTELEALTISTSDNQYAQVTAAGEVFEFLSPEGKKGLIKIESVNQLNNTAGSITVSVKIQR